MKTSLGRRVTGEHGASCQALLDGLLEASRRPEAAFDIVEKMAVEHPEIGRQLVRASNAAGRRGYHRVTSVRAALVRLGMVQASQILLEDVNRFSPTRFDRAA